MPQVSIEDTTNVEQSVEPVVETAPETDADVAPETELFDGGPTKAQIDEWKSKFGKIYVTEVADEKYVVWRTLRRAEYRNLVADMERAVSNGASNAEASMNNEEAITQMCSLWPSGLTLQGLGVDLAGLPAIISQQVMEASGFMSLQVREL